MAVEPALSLAAANRPRSIDALAALVRIPSPTGEEGAAQSYVAGMLGRIGAEIEIAEPDIAALFDRFPAVAQYPTHWRHDLALPYEQLPSYDALVKSGLIEVLNYRGRPNVVGVVQGTGGGRSLILNGHVDTVTIEPREQWKRQPFGAEIEDGFMYGRGTSDMKGGLMAALMAMTYLQEAGVRLRGDLILQSVVNEEHAGNGTLETVRRGYSATASVVVEPTNNEVFISHPGGLYWQLVVPGVARSPGARWEAGRAVGVSAIEKLPEVIGPLLALEEKFNRGTAGNGQKPFSLVIGKVSGGHYETVTAGEVTLRGGAYFAPEAGRLEEIMAAFRAAIAGANEADPFLKRHPARLSFLHHDDAASQTPDLAVAQLAARLIERRGGKGGIGRSPFCCDMRHLVNQGGIPSIIFGPGTIAEAHRPDERITLAEYTACIEHLIAFMGEWCNQ